MLHVSEACQCPACESYSRLGELIDAKKDKRGGVVVNRKSLPDRGGKIGKCPYCGEEIGQSDVC